MDEVESKFGLVYLFSMNNAELKMKGEVQDTEFKVKYASFSFYFFIYFFFWWHWGASFSDRLS
jgi:hypothetical protein